eukprot:1116767-Pleurochrysis_carterae.AAC.2
MIQRRRRVLERAVRDEVDLKLSCAPFPTRKELLARHAQLHKFVNARAGAHLGELVEDLVDLRLGVHVKVLREPRGRVRGRPRRAVHLTAQHWVVLQDGRDHLQRALIVPRRQPVGVLDRPRLRHRNEPLLARAVEEDVVLLHHPAHACERLGLLARLCLRLSPPEPAVRRQHQPAPDVASLYERVHLDERRLFHRRGDSVKDALVGRAARLVLRRMQRPRHTDARIGRDLRDPAEKVELVRALVHREQAALKLAVLLKPLGDAILGLQVLTFPRWGSSADRDRIARRAAAVGAHDDGVGDAGGDQSTHERLGAHHRQSLHHRVRLGW